jgi:hypothetical protein
MSKIRFLGLDVHVDTIAVAVAEQGGEVCALGVIPNRLEGIRKLVVKLGQSRTSRCATKPVPAALFCIAN